jgi:hypothetical protein
MWLKQYSACLASVRPLIQTPVLSKKKKERKKERRGEGPVNIYIINKIK